MSLMTIDQLDMAVPKARYEDLVADEVAVCVVDRLEVVHVLRRQRRRHRLALGDRVAAPERVRVTERPHRQE